MAVCINHDMVKGPIELKAERLFKTIRSYICTDNEDPHTGCSHLIMIVIFRVRIIKPCF